MPKDRRKIESLLKESKNVSRFLVGTRAVNQDAANKNDLLSTLISTKSNVAKPLSESSGDTNLLISKRENKENVPSKSNLYSQAAWEKILKNNDLENTSTTELVTSLRQGIPTKM